MPQPLEFNQGPDVIMNFETAAKAAGEEAAAKEAERTLAEEIGRQVAKGAIAHLREGEEKAQARREEGDAQQTNGPSFLGFLREEGLNVLSRTLTTVGGGGQVLLGGALCTTVAGCALGGPLAALGASNIQEGLTGEDGFARDAFQSVLGENNGDLAFGAVNLGTSVGGLARPVLKQGARPLFRTIPDDFQPAFRQATDVGLGAEVLSSGANIVDTIDHTRR